MEIYYIPFQEQFIVFRPLLSLAFVGNKALVEYIENRIADKQIPDPEIEEFLNSLDFWRTESKVNPPNIEEATLPNIAVLLLTNQCNLRCTYCYADAGERSPEVMTWPVAKAVIDQAFNNAKDSGAKEFSLSFHGGGEPTACWDILEKSVLYALKKDLPCRVSLTSNGVWSDKQREFICKHFEQVSLSMDGVALVQNKQRPFANGKGSFACVMESIAALDEAGISYGIRMTVLPESVAMIQESVDFFCKNTKASSIQIEPTYTSRRGVYDEVDAEFADEFVAALGDAMTKGREQNVFVYYSAARPWVVTPLFCMAPMKALVSTAKGELVTCYEVTSSELDHAPDFIVGKVEGAEAKQDSKALQHFLELQQERRESCRDCFCYWHCAGDCATRSLTGTGANSMRCYINKNLSIEVLANLIADGDGIWDGRRERHFATVQEPGE